MADGSDECVCVWTSWQGKIGSTQGQQMRAKVQSTSHVFVVIMHQQSVNRKACVCSHSRCRCANFHLPLYSAGRKQKICFVVCFILSSFFSYLFVLQWWGSMMDQSGSYCKSKFSFLGHLWVCSMVPLINITYCGGVRIGLCFFSGFSKYFNDLKFPF